ncbi:MAG: hypothetical protein HY670_09295 [Chloroflexi bacterium]|nr:hypothetical protein [Chloroflexota bacterium]
MKKGFKKIILDLVRENPGLTAKEYAKVALDRGLSGSDSKDPVFSLATTLMKEVREERIPGIKAVGRRPLRFYPDDYTSSEQMKKADDIVKKILSNWDKPITILLPADIAQAMDMLVEVSKFGNRGEALIWLAREGIRAKNIELTQVKKVVEQIKLLKQSVPV